LPPEPPRRLVAVEVAGVRGAAVDRGDAVVEVVGVDRRAVDQCGSIARCRVRHRAGQPVPDVIVSIGDGGIRPRFLGQLALVVVSVVRGSIACCRAALGDALALAVRPQDVVELGHYGVAAVLVDDVGQAVQRVIGVARRAEHRACCVGAGNALAVAHLVVTKQCHGAVRVRGLVFQYS